MRDIHPSQSKDADAALRTLDFTGYAQEFLRRNQAYRGFYASLNTASSTSDEKTVSDAVQSWGLMFPINPDSSAWSDPAIWLSEAAPAILIFEPTPLTPRGLTIDRILTDQEIMLDRSHGQGRHIYLASQKGLHRLWFNNPDTDASFAAKVNTGSDFGIRIDALRSFHASLSSPSTSHSSKCLLPTAFQRFRLNLMLKVLDYLTVADPGATIRSVSSNVTYPHSSFSSAAEWKGSSERRRTQRLIGQARFLTKSGYRELLKGSIPSQTC